MGKKKATSKKKNKKNPRVYHSAGSATKMRSKSTLTAAKAEGLTVQEKKPLGKAELAQLARQVFVSGRSGDPHSQPTRMLSSLQHAVTVGRAHMKMMPVSGSGALQ